MLTNYVRTSWDFEDEESAVSIRAQEYYRRLVNLPQAKEDTNAVFLYINIGQQFETNDPEFAKSYYRKAGDLSRKINYPKGIIKYINNYTFVLNMQGLYDSSLMADEDCYELLLEGEPSGVIEFPVEWVRDDAVYFMMHRFQSLRPHTPPTDVFVR